MALYFVISIIILTIMLLSNNFDFITTYFNINEWRIIHIVCLPLIPTILIFVLICLVFEFIGYIFDNIKPVLDKKIFK